MRDRSARDPFPSTHWSFVTLAGAEDAAIRSRALAEFFERYRPALRAYLRGTQRLSEHDADDLLQGFMADKIIEQDLLAHATEGRGRFRSYLLGVLRHYVNDWRRRARFRRQTPGETASLDGEPASGAPDHTAAFEVEWARQVVKEAVRRVSEECREKGRDDLWQVFDGRVLRPCIHQEPPTPTDELARRCGLGSAAEVSNRLVTAKRLFSRHLTAVVAEYARDPQETQTEVQDLLSVLAQAGGKPRFREAIHVDDQP